MAHALGVTRPARHAVYEDLYDKYVRAMTSSTGTTERDGDPQTDSPTPGEEVGIAERTRDDL
jgi:hypothetical protein